MVFRPYRGAAKFAKNAARILKNSFAKGSLLLRNVRSQYIKPPIPKKLDNILEDLHLNSLDQMPGKTILLTYKGSFHIASRKRFANRSATFPKYLRSFLARNINSAKCTSRKSLKTIIENLTN